MMSESEIKKMIRQEVAAQMNIILSGQSANATNVAEDIQTLFPGMPGITGRPTMHPYGFCSLAPDGTISVTAKQGSHPGNRMTLGHRAADRPTDLDTGEAAVYSVAGYRIVLRNNTIVLSKGTDYETLVVGDTLLNFLEQLLTLIINHTHGGPGVAPTNDVQFEQLKAQFLDNSKILAKDGGRY